MQHFEICRWQFIAVNGTLLCSGAGFDKETEKKNTRRRNQRYRLDYSLFLLYLFHEILILGEMSLKHAIYLKG